MIRRARNETTCWLLALASGVGVVAAQDPPSNRQKVEAVRATDFGSGNEGFIHGTIRTREGRTYRGLMRWEDEEFFWDDLFNSSKEDDRFSRFLPSDERRHGRAIKIFGFTIGYSWDEHEVSRQFIARFGDIERIEVTGKNGGDVVMKSGERYYVEGFANDVGNEIHVYDWELGRAEIRWRDIDKIEFSVTPRNAKPPAERLFGTVVTGAGTFEGFVQWDSEECLTTDELDGESEDGDMSIPMGNIESIEKRNRKGSWVELRNGRRVLLEDTNDVDHSIRGILVEDPRYGRVKISWDAFERVDFRKVAASGRGYDAYRPARPLQGTVETRDGKTHSGRIVYDLDEAETWEFLNGDSFGVEYYVPFERILSVERRGSDACLVVLHDGTELVLEGRTDVDDDNAGILVFRSDDRDPVYVPWDRVERITFEKG